MRAHVCLPVRGRGGGGGEKETERQRGIETETERQQSDRWTDRQRQSGETEGERVCAHRRINGKAFTNTSRHN